LKTDYDGNPYDHYDCNVLPTPPPTTETCTVVFNAAISGYNSVHLTGQTVASCQDACSGYSWCQSFDWYKYSNECDLSDKSASDVGGLKTDYDGNPYDHYACGGARRLQMATTTSWLRSATDAVAEANDVLV